MFHSTVSGSFGLLVRLLRLAVVTLVACDCVLFGLFTVDVAKVLAMGSVLVGWLLRLVVKACCDCAIFP